MLSSSMIVDVSMPQYTMTFPHDRWPPGRIAFYLVLVLPLAFGAVAFWSHILGVW